MNNSGFQKGKGMGGGGGVPGGKCPALEPGAHHFNDWSPDIILAEEPVAQRHFPRSGAQCFEISSLEYPDPIVCFIS